MKKNVWFLPSEVVIHNTPEDIWVVVPNNRVLDLSSLIKEHKNDEKTLPLISFAGKNVSHWFDREGNFRTYIDPTTGKTLPYTPYGKVIDVIDTSDPKSKLILVHKKPWWKDERFFIGYLTKNPRPLRFVNTLTETTVEIDVCEEETFEAIAERYKKFNSDCFSYSWWYLDQPICMNKTLHGNGIKDDRRRFRQLRLPEDFFVPAIILIFIDDCTDFCENFDVYKDKTDSCTSYLDVCEN